MQTLSWKIDTTKKDFGLPIVIFNSHCFDVEEVIEINNNALKIKDVNGNDVPFVNAPSEAQPVFERDNAVFKVKVPALGYAVYYYTPSVDFNGTNTEGDYAVRAKKCADLTLENEYLKVQFNEQGAPVSVFDKRTGKETLNGAARSVVIDESAHDTWSHGKNYFDNEIGEFKTVKATKLESNDVRETVKVSSVYGESSLTQYYTLNAGEEFVRVRVKMNWNEKHKMLKFAYPVACEAPTSVYEIPFGTVERPCNGEEESALM